MKKVITIMGLLGLMIAQAQVGINNTVPKATLDVEAMTTQGSTVEGVLIPRISREKAAIMSNPVTNTEVSTLVYINDVTTPSSDAANTTKSVKENGFYFFDGTQWNMMKVDKPSTGTTLIKTLEYAINAVAIDSNTPAASETCIGNLCIRLNETNPSAGNAIVQYKLKDLANDNLNIWGEKVGGGGNFHEVQHQGLVYRESAQGWQNFEVWPHVSNSDMAKYTVSFINTKQIYRVNVSVNPNDSATGLVSGVSIYLERMHY